MITPKNSQHSTELAIFGYLLARNKKPYLAGDVFAICTPKAFMHSDTRAVAEAVKALAERREDPDIVAVVKELEVQKKLADVGGASFVAALADEFGGAIWTESSLLDAAKGLAEELRKREAQVDLSGVVRNVQTPGIPASRVAEELRSVALALDSGASYSGASFDQQLDEYAAGLESPERSVKPVKTPWATVTRILRGGILPGELGVLAARPSVGKTAFALNFAWSVACSGKVAQFNSLEMGRQSLIDRLVSNVGNIDLGSFREGLTPKERETARKTVECMRGVGLQVFDAFTAKVSDIRHRIRVAQQQEKEIGLVVVDYLQLMEPQTRLSSREREVAEMSRSLKALAGELCVPVLLLAQLNRKSEEAKREPMLSDLRESGAIEQDADIVIFLHQARSVYGNPNEPVKAIVAKGRSSGVGKAHLEFHRRFQRFVDSDEAVFLGAQRKEEEEQRRHWTDGQGELK